jgi:hypothetical protein
LADSKLGLQEALDTHKRWLEAKFRSIPEIIDWDINRLFWLERQQIRELLNWAVYELKEYIRERTPPPEY